jgi:predicted  nucleic acid-binding Zn-ribbon protein
MAGKPNIRSIRFSDELAELIDRQVGNTFTEKFENLVTRCVWELPQREAELKEVQKQIRQEEKRLADLRKRRTVLDQTIQSIQKRLDYHLRELEKL